MNLDLSLVIPVLNEEESLPELLKWIFKIFDIHHISGEILLIDDGSHDNSWQVIQEYSKKDKRIKGYRFTRNYGKSAALQAGFNVAMGKVVITMDADLQDSPDEIPDLMKMVNENDTHIVSGWKKKRYDPISKTIPSKFFNWVTSKASGIQLHDFNCGLKAYSNEVVKNIYVYGEMHRYIPLIAKWNGFVNIKEKVVMHRERKYGHTKYGFKRFITGFLDLASVIFVTRFKKNPMHFFGVMGTMSFLSGFLISIYILGKKIYLQNLGLPVRDAVDQPLFFISLIALLIGVQLFLTGFLAEMMIQTNKHNKEDYLVKEKTNS